jgi:hypothetical protein
VSPCTATKTGTVAFEPLATFSASALSSLAFAPSVAVLIFAGFPEPPGAAYDTAEPVSTMTRSSTAASGQPLWIVSLIPFSLRNR